MVEINVGRMRIMQNYGEHGMFWEIMVIEMFSADSVLYRLKEGTWSMSFEGDPILVRFGYVNQSSERLKDNLRMSRGIGSI